MIKFAKQKWTNCVH